MTKLHILIPTYNCAEFIGATLNSIFNDTLADIRVTVVDNVSTDGTGDLIREEFGTTVEYIRNNENIGGIRNHNRCMEIAEGQYIKLLSADDLLLPGMLATQIAALDNNPSVGISTCDNQLIDSAGKQIGLARYLKGFYRGPDAIRICAAKVANLVGGPSQTMLRTDAIQGHRWDPQFAWTADLMFYLSMLRDSDLIGTGELGVAYRRRSGSISEASCPLPVRCRSDLELLRRFARSPLPFLRWGVRYAKAGLS